jgi:hypothetical protein
MINGSTVVGMALGACLALAAGYGTVRAQNGQSGGRPAVVATVRLGTVVEKLDKRAAEFANLQAFRAAAQKEQERSNSTPWSRPTAWTTPRLRC